jgi:hypothetical protein
MPKHPFNRLSRELTPFCHDLRVCRQPAGIVGHKTIITTEWRNLVPIEFAHGRAVTGAEHLPQE